MLRRSIHIHTYIVHNMHFRHVPEYSGGHIYISSRNPCNDVDPPDDNNWALIKLGRAAVMPTENQLAQVKLRYFAFVYGLATRSVPGFNLNN